MGACEKVLGQIQLELVMAGLWVLREKNSVKPE